MRKRLLLIITILWVVAFVRMILFEEKDNNINIATAFSNERFVYTESILSVNASLGNEYFTEEEKGKYIKKLAKGIGLDNEYSIENKRQENESTVEISKAAKNAYTSIRIVTNETQKDDSIILVKNYLYIDIKISNSLESAVMYKERVKKVLEDMNIVGDISLNLIGNVKGELNDTEKNNISDEIMKNLEADYITGNTNKGIYTIYAYSEGIKDYIMLGDKKTNINIAITYDEKNNLTKIYMATPIITQDF